MNQSFKNGPEEHLGPDTDAHRYRDVYLKARPGIRLGYTLISGSGALEMTHYTAAPARVPRPVK